MFTRVALVSSIMLSLGAIARAQAPGRGHFDGILDLRPVGDGRHMKILNRFSYTDWEGHRLTADAGFVSDGATIPRAAWTLVGGPWDGLYIQAAIVHDVGCVTHELSWQITDRLFYEAMIDSNVPKAQALTMYYAVLVGGPRWQLTSVKTAATQAELDNYLKQFPAPKPEEAVNSHGVTGGGRPGSQQAAIPKDTTTVMQDKGDDPSHPVFRAKVYTVQPARDISSARLKSVNQTIAESQNTANPLTPEDIERIASQTVE